MYLALFLAPWVLMYAISTFVMNHRDVIRGRPAPPPKWETIRNDEYSTEFSPGASAELMAGQILSTLNLEGAHQQNLRDGKLVIQRMDALRPYRITYTAAEKKLLVERQTFDTPAFLERMHRRRGFQHPYLLEDLWAFSVDLFIAAVIFWALSGLWLWWELKVTRRLGAIFAISGIALFAFFLVKL